MDNRDVARDAISAVQICMLLDSVCAMREAGSSSAVRDVLGRHVFELVREMVPADEVCLWFDDDEPAGKERGRAQLKKESGNRHRTMAPLVVRGEQAGALILERLAKTFTDKEKLVISAIARVISIALENARSVEPIKEDSGRDRSDPEFDDNMAGESPALNKIKNNIRLVAARETTVLIIGETGTGKELVARSIHLQSPRAAGPFVAINCAALTETLLESELFGFEKGAFTGASARKIGLLETAQGGTVFLDEIGEMPVALQAKLLRFLQNRELQRVGGTETISLDVRLIAATNRDLQSGVQKGAFREDLYYRLSVVTIRTPPLRERPEDIAPLTRHFIRQFTGKGGRRVIGIASNVREILQTYDWPGNIRELENAIEHAVVLGSGEMIMPEDLPEKLIERWADAGSRESGMLQGAVNSAKRSVVKRAFDIAGGDHAEAARILGVHPNYLYRLLKNLELDAF